MAPIEPKFLSEFPFTSQSSNSEFYVPPRQKLLCLLPCIGDILAEGALHTGRSLSTAECEWLLSTTTTTAGNAPPDTL
ncbi:unnamed protein product [Soboliphyme baturini]|uniref:Uncharacterized protein n=1 Tax=Soboliphyme baturini TaxID=241478 RepID=A0A183J200_9BILA|nr:unnamed protein product [Soboliphyme baturini]